MGNELGSMGSVASHQGSHSIYNPDIDGDCMNPDNNNNSRVIPRSVESNTKYGKWVDAEDCNCSASRRQVLEIRIVRTPLLSTASDIGLSAVRITANVVTVGYVEKWLGIHGTPLEHQAIECDVFCLDCMQELIYTFEYLGGIGKLDRAGSYTNQYNGYYKQRKIKNTILYLSDIYEIYYSIPGKWKARHYDAVKNNCQLFAQLFWSQLFGSEEDDHGQWQSQTQYKCKCKINMISVKRIKLIRVQKNSDSEEHKSLMINNTINLISLGIIDAKSMKNENDSILHGIELYCKCTKCNTKIYYTLENSQRGKYFRCGLYGKQLKPLREIQKRKSLDLETIHSIYKSFDIKVNDNKRWTCLFWNRLFQAVNLNNISDQFDHNGFEQKKHHHINNDNYEQKQQSFNHFNCINE